MEHLHTDNPKRNVCPLRPCSRPAWCALSAHVVSYIFHPLFIPLYVIAFLLYVHPLAFAGFDQTDEGSTPVHSAVLAPPCFLRFQYSCSGGWTLSNLFFCVHKKSASFLTRFRSYFISGHGMYSKTCVTPRS